MFARSVAVLLAAALLLLSHCVSSRKQAAAVAIEHMYVEPPEPEGGMLVMGLKMKNNSKNKKSQNGAEKVDAARRKEVPLSAKGKCKGSGCPDLHGKVVILEGCKWESLNRARFVVEETSGWYFFYHYDEEKVAEMKQKAARKSSQKEKEVKSGGVSGSVGGFDFSHLEPVRPTAEEVSRIYDNNERGYLGQRSGGQVYLA